jgi:PAS domain S-box-containing protein
MAERTANFGSWDWIQPGRLMRWSKGSYALYEYPAGQPVTYQMWRDRIDPADLPRVTQAIRSAFQAGTGYDVEFQLRLPSGKQRWINARGEVTEHRDGKPFRMSGINFDITSRKLNEQAVAAQSEQIRALSDRLRLALDAAKMGWWHFDPTTGIASFDDTLVEMLQLSEDTLPLEAIFEHLHPEDVPAIRVQLAGALDPVRHEPFHVECRAILPGGRIRWIEGYGIASFDGAGEDRRAIGLVGTTSDITERKLSEESLWASNKRTKRVSERLRLALDAASLGWWHWDIRSNLATWDDRFKEIYAVPTYEAALPDILALIHPDDVGQVWDAFQSAMDSHHPTPYAAEYRLVLPDGSLRWVEAHGNGHLEGEGDERRIAYLVGTVEDITEAKAASEALRRSQEQLSLVLQASDLGTWDWDLLTDRIEWSTRCLALFGLPPEHTNLTYKQCLQLIHPEDRERIQEAIQAAIETRQQYRVEMRTIWPDGSVHWIYSAGHVYYDAQGQPVRMSGAALDMTERKLAEAAIRSSEERYRLLIEQTVDGIFVADEQGNYLDVNPAGAALLGYTQEEICQLKITDVITQSEAKRIAPEVAKFADGAIVRSEWQFLRKDGTLFDGEVIGRQLPDGRLQAVVRDITEQKTAENALRTSEQRLRLSQQAAKIGSFRWNIETDTNEWSPELEAMYGLAPGEFPRTQRAWEDLIHPEDRAAAIRAVEHAFGGNEPVEAEWRVIWPDGSIRWILGRFQLLRDADGKPLSLVGASLDTTERKQTEENLRKAERLASAGRMAGIVAHEINNPLDTVVNCLALLKNSTLATAQREYLNIATEELQRVVRITRHTLGSYRAGEKPQSFDCSQLADDVISAFVPVAKGRGVDLQSRVQPAQMVEGFSGEIRQLLNNLIINAMDAGGMRVRVRIAVSHDHKQPERRGVRLSVIDDGKGISEKVAPNIFDLFFTTKGEKGTGLGLWVCRGIVQKHEGSITFRTSTKANASFSIFSVFLPSPSHPVNAENAPQLSGGTLRLRPLNRRGNRVAPPG